MATSNRSLILLSVMGALWYANLVVFIVSETEFPGSHALRDYDLLIGILFIVMTAAFRQTYVIWKKGRPQEY